MNSFRSLIPDQPAAVEVFGKHQENIVRKMKTPLQPQFYIGKLGFTGVYIIFLFLL